MQVKLNKCLSVIPSVFVGEMSLFGFHFTFNINFKIIIRIKCSVKIYFVKKRDLLKNWKNGNLQKIRNNKKTKI